MCIRDRGKDILSKARRTKPELRRWRLSTRSHIISWLVFREERAHQCEDDEEKHDRHADLELGVPTHEIKRFVLLPGLCHSALSLPLHPNARSRVHKDIREVDQEVGKQHADDNKETRPLSYTHLTLPTIYSV